MRQLVVLLAVAGLAMAAQLPEPGHLAMVLGEEEFEDYLDMWLATEEPKWVNASRSVARNTNGCEFRVNGDLGQPQPVYLHNGDFLDPTSNSGLIHVAQGDKITIGCSSRFIRHPNFSGSLASAEATCVKDNIVSGDGWLTADGEFGDFTCSAHSYHDAEYTGETCYKNNKVIRIGFYVDGVFYPKYWSCFDSDRMEVLYVWYEQRPQNAVHQTGVDRPSWLAGSFFPGVAINTEYTQVQQAISIANIVGEDLAKQYVTSYQFLSRGHLAAKTDFVYATGQRASFWFINSAPQWQPFNGGNWNWVEQNLRERIGVAGYETMVYTGTWGVTQLRNQEGKLVDIYLNKDANNNDRIPVPLYYYKVVYDESRKIGTVFIGINNPWYTEEEVKQLTFCTDRCRNNSNFSWLRWSIDSIALGYSFCCEIPDFQKTVDHLDHINFDVSNGLLY